MSLEFNRIVTQVLNEKYYAYTPPKDKETLMYDFYVVNYLMFLLGQPSKTHRDLREDIVYSVKDTAKNLYTGYSITTTYRTKLTKQELHDKRTKI